MSKNWLKAAGIVILAVIFLLAGSTAVRAENRVVVGQTAEAPGLHTLVEVDIYAAERFNLINQPLMVIDYDLDLIPGLATSWEVSDDAMRIDMELRQDVLWHHGREFVAEDVKYTYEWILDEDTPAANRDLYAAIEEIEIIDDHNIVFHLSEPYTFLLNNMARVGVIPYDHHEEVGYNEFQQAPIGTGPYVHDEWSDDDYHILTAFEDYWGGSPYFDVVEFRPIPEDSSRLLAFEAGEIDMFQGGVVPEEIERLEEDADVGVYRTAGTGYTYMGMNQKTDLNPEVIQNRKFREAVAYSINREGIVDHVQEGIGSPGKSQITPDMAHFNDEIDYPTYDPARAAELFAESGVEEGVTVELYTNEDPIRMQIAEIMEFELGRLGVNVNVNIEEWGAFLDRIYDTNDYDLFILGWGGQVDPDRASYRQFHSEGTANHVNFSDERMDELLERGRAVDPGSEESREIYREVQEILLREHPKAFIFYTEEVAIVNPKFEGFRVHPYAANAWLQLADQLEIVE